MHYQPNGKSSYFSIHPSHQQSSFCFLDVVPDWDLGWLRDHYVFPQRNYTNSYGVSHKNDYNRETWLWRVMTLIFMVHVRTTQPISYVLESDWSIQMTFIWYSMLRGVAVQSMSPNMSQYQAFSSQISALSNQNVFIIILPLNNAYAYYTLKISYILWTILTSKIAFCVIKCDWESPVDYTLSTKKTIFIIILRLTNAHMRESICNEYYAFENISIYFEQCYLRKTAFWVIKNAFT